MTRQLNKEQSTDPGVATTFHLNHLLSALSLSVMPAQLEQNRGAEHEHLEEVMAFYERRSSRWIIRYWRARRARIRKAEAEALRRERAAAKEKARQEAVLHVSVGDDDEEEEEEEEEEVEDRSSDAAPVSPIRTQIDEDEEDMSDEPGPASPSDARVGANLRLVVFRGRVCGHQSRNREYGKRLLLDPTHAHCERVWVDLTYRRADPR